MAFSFKVTGSFYHVATEMREIELKASEETIREGDLQIDTSHLLGPQPYIVVTCQDEGKGKRLMERVERELPRFLRV